MCMNTRAALRPWPLHREQLDAATALGDVAHVVRMTWRRAGLLARVALAFAAVLFIVGASVVAAGVVVAALAVGSR